MAETNEIMKKLLAAALAALVCGTTPVFAEEDADYVILAHVDYDYERMQQGSMTYIAGSTSGMGIILQSKTDLFGKGEHLDMRCLIYVIRGSEELDLMAPCTVTNAGKEQLNVMAIRKAPQRSSGGRRTRSAHPARGHWTLRGSFWQLRLPDRLPARRPVRHDYPVHLGAVIGRTCDSVLNRCGRGGSAGFRFLPHAPATRSPLIVPGAIAREPAMSETRDSPRRGHLDRFVPDRLLPHDARMRRALSWKDEMDDFDKGRVSGQENTSWMNWIVAASQPLN